jgi:hypothetical protein
VKLAFIIVFGTRWHFRPRDGGFQGFLNCPGCREPTRMVQEHAFQAFTLYFWPLFTVQDAGDLLLCTECGGRFDLPPELRPDSEPEMA